VRRRALLTGLVGAVGLAMLPRGGRSEPRPRRRRLILIQQNNGIQQANFWPTAGAFTSPILEPLLQNPNVARQTIAVRGVSFPNTFDGTDGNEHDVGFIRLWTGEKMKAVAGHPWGGGPSVDQILARAWGQDSLTLAVHSSTLQAFPKPGFQHRRSFSYVAPGVHKLPTLDPFAAYSKLFWGGGAEIDALARQRLRLRKSALDAATADLADLKRRLGPRESARLEAHTESLREVEHRLSDLLAGTPGPGASCAARPSPPTDYSDAAPSALVSDERFVPDMVRAHMDVMVAALACGLTRVATLQLSYCGGHWKFDWLGVGVDQHELAHKDTADAGGADAKATEQLVRVNRWYTEQIAYLANRLDALPSAGGTLLDQTLIAWGNELGRGDHSQSNVPIVLIGGGGAAGPGGRVIDAGVQPFQRVGCTVLRAMGHHVDGFGDQPTCGPLVGL
jgi:hypothetical protein